MPERRTVTVAVTIEGQAVDCLVDRLSVAELNTVAGLMYPRGTGAVDPDGTILERVAAIDAALRAAPGALETDAPERGLASLYVSQPDVLHQLYQTVLDAQEPSARERLDLRIAARFTRWLEQSRRRKVESPWTKTGASCAACHALQLCEKRGCDGSTKPKTVWFDGPLKVKTCPVLSFTVEVEWALRTFYWTHELTWLGQTAFWVQQRLMRPGGVEDQEAWLLAALAVIRSEHNAMAREQAKQEPVDA